MVEIMEDTRITVGSWQTDDNEWFAANPSRKYRLRRPQPGDDPTAQLYSHVVVTRLDGNNWLAQSINVPTQFADRLYGTDGQIDTVLAVLAAKLAASMK